MENKTKDIRLLKDILYEVRVIKPLLFVIEGLRNDRYNDDDIPELNKKVLRYKEVAEVLQNEKVVYRLPSNQIMSKENQALYLNNFLNLLEIFESHK